MEVFTLGKLVTKPQMESDYLASGGDWQTRCQCWFLLCHIGESGSQVSCVHCEASVPRTWSTIFFTILLAL